MLGAYADRHGRKASLMISIVLMTIGTLAIAVMPTYGDASASWRRSRF